MLISMIRFVALGWVEKLYIAPEFHFSYYGFEWIKPIGSWTYLLFAICGVSAIGVALGYRYRLSIILLFLSFTYIELMDKTTYLNHYYFVSILSFLMIFLPMATGNSLDIRDGRINKYTHVPRWTIDSIKLLLSIVYVYAGLAKLNSDWLLRAMPLKIWLPAKYDLPLLGSFLSQEWVAYAFSWSGALYDLAIPFLLLYRRTRLYAFIVVVIFHLLTRWLFPIGMFPYIMIAGTLIFFSEEWHKRAVYAFAKAIKFSAQKFKLRSPTVAKARHLSTETRIYTYQKPRVVKTVLLTFFFIQLLLPWRYLLYPDELFWTEEGYRFSWRVMLMEKAGYVQYKIKDGVNGKTFFVNNSDFLTPFQEKQMSFQPDFILEYAHYLRDHFENQGHQQVQVYAESRVALNGRISRPYINPQINLAEVEESFNHKEWVLPFDDEIRGL